MGGGGPKPADHLGQKPEQGRSDEADDEAATPLPRNLAHHDAQLIHPRQNMHGMFVEQPSGLGQPQGPGVAVEQLDADLVLELADLAAQRRLGDVEDLGRAGEVPLIGDGDEVAKVAQFHNHTYRVS